MIHGDSPADLGESEPPHIKNWFSSYEYESFVLETNDNFGFSEHQESQDFKNECSTGNTLISTENAKKLVTNEESESVLIECNQSEEQNKCEKQVLESQDSPLLTPEPTGIENWFSSYVYESPEVDTIQDIIVSNHNKNLVDFKEKVSKKDLFTLNKDEILCATPTDDLVCKQASECDKVSSKDDEMLTDLPKEYANGDGFVSIKSKKGKYEKSKEVKGVDQERYVLKSVNNVNNNNKKRGERVTLGDVTNIVDEDSSETGKWKCPRKRKPDMGPPLKQLRLGQWFRYV